jgi:hypothetical protein
MEKRRPNMIRTNIDENKVVRLYREEYLTHKSIAKIFNCSAWKIQEILKSNKIPPNYKKTFRSTNQEFFVKDIIDLFINQNKTTSQIGKLYNCCGDYIRKILNKNGVKTPRSRGKTTTRKSRQKKFGDNDYTKDCEKITIKIFGKKMF